ncbi:MAG: cation transporter [Mariprofundaceae bacterium]|nr:cation transporter [Mariprofundaceae bacterium]
MLECGCTAGIRNREQRKALIPLLFINGLMFFIEFSLGIISQSTALIADSVDMLADATVYGISLYAVGRSVRTKINAARLSGAFQILLGFGVVADVVRRFVLGTAPEAMFMIIVGFLALAANVLCLAIIARHRKDEVHMRASWIFSRNDVLANAGVIIAGVLVSMLASPLPDLIIGLLIAVVVIHGGISILRDARTYNENHVIGQEEI